MAKAVLVALSVDIADTLQGQPATVTIGGVTYTGTVQAIIVYTPTSNPAVSTVTLKGVGLGTG